MKFEGEWETVICEDCDREISHLHDEGFEDNPLCVGCRSRQLVEHQNSKCDICKKKMGDEDYHYSMDEPDITAHSSCVEQLPEDEGEEWSDNFND